MKVLEEIKSIKCNLNYAIPNSIKDLVFKKIDLLVGTHMGDNVRKM